MTRNPVSGVPVFVGPNIRRSTLGAVCDARDGVGESRYQRALVDQWRVGIVARSKVKVARIAQLHLDPGSSRTFRQILRQNSAIFQPAVTRPVIRVLYGHHIAVGGIVVRFGVVVALDGAARVPPSEYYVPVRGCESGRSRIAIKLVIGEVKVKTVSKGEVIVDLVLVALEAKATVRAKNHVVMDRFLDPARMPVESDAVSVYVMNPVPANHDIAR